MSNAVLFKHRDIKPTSDVAKTEALLSILVEMTPQQQERFWIKNQEVGYVCVFEHESHPGVVLEYVQGSKDDSVSTLYEGNLKIASISHLEEVRRDLINEIGRVLMALPSTVVVHDAGRMRDVSLKELGTAQLMDVLAHFTHTDINTL